MALALTLALATGAAAGYREIARHQAADTLAIRGPRGIDEAGFVRIGGLDQWITIRGQDRTRPVILVLHGGPGGAMSHLIREMRPLERDHVVVQWDQRGAGRTLARAGGRVDPGLDIATMVRDGVEVSEYVRAHLHRERIVLLGWSWGSYLGVQMAQARPDLYAAYVGTGEAAAAEAEQNRARFAWLLARARAAGDAQAQAVLGQVGPPPWKDPRASQRLWKISGPYRGPMLSYWGGAWEALTAPNWTLADVRALARGRSTFRDTRLERQVWADDMTAFGRRLDIPVLIIQGEEDTTTPTSLARAWFDRLDAPAKAFAVIPGAGHQALVTHNAAFTQALDANLPALLAGRPTAD